jgi:hypothetical protein
MPWWSWIVIWIALVALSLLFFVVLGVRLYRKFMTTVKELGEAGDRFGHLPSATPVPAPAEPGAPATPTALASGSAVFAPPARVRHDYEAAKAARREARRLRRVQRKADRGQPQRLHDIEFS